MSLAHIERNPSEKLLRQFGALLPLFGLLVGFMLVYKYQLWVIAICLFALCAILGIIGLVSPKSLRPVWVGWMVAVFPIQWVVSHVVLLMVFYLVMTPVGLLMRAFGRDPLERRWDPKAKTYWQPHAPPAKSSRYFRQF